MIEQVKTFSVDRRQGLTDVLARLTEGFACRRVGADQQTECYLDSFDWRVFRGGGRLRLVDGDSRRVLELIRSGRREIADATTAPEFASELPGGRLRDMLAPVLELRRLFPVATVRTTSQRWDVLDDEEKIICRLFTERRECVDETGSWRRLRPTLRMDEVRGYEDECRPLLALLKEQLGLRPTSDDGLIDACAALGRRAGHDPTALEVAVEPDMPAADSVSSVLQALLAVMREHERGVAASFDIEFLHDFRVAVRRTRALQGQLGDLFAAGSIARFKKEFRWLGSVTSPARDLDVFLVNLDEYADRLPESASATVPRLRQVLESRRLEEQARITSALSGNRYGDLVAGWRALLRSRASFPDTRRVGVVVGEQVRKRFRAIKRMAKGGDLSVADLHELRIQCKKLRYLVELFAGAFHAAAATTIVKAVKRLQNSFGDFNDYDVHARMLCELAEQWPGEDPEQSRDLLVLGRLVGFLEAKREALRQGCTNGLSGFCAGDGRAAVKRLIPTVREAGEEGP